jgi:hypothetical protein
LIFKTTLKDAKMKKSILVAAALMSVSTFSFAESWVASGVRQISAINSAVVTYLPISTDGFTSEQLCNDFVTAQNSIIFGNNVKGSRVISKVDAACSQVAE